METTLRAPAFDLQAQFDPATLAWSVVHAGTAWNSLPGFEPYIEYLPLAERTAQAARRLDNQTGQLFEGARILLREAAQVEHTPFETGVGHGLRSRFAGFRYRGAPVPLQLETSVWLERANGSLHFELVPIVDDPGVLRMVYPAPFELPARDESCYSVLPYMQGCLIPNNWPEEIPRYNMGLLYSRAAYMPWWGQVAGRAGAITIIDTPWDAGLWLDHPAGGPTRLYPVWHPSLGEVRYTRRLQVRFVPDGDYNDLCKVYRAVTRERGELRSLAEKMVENPNLARLIGSPVVHTLTLTDVKPESRYYDPEHPEYNYSLITFDQTAQKLRALKARGAGRVYLHLDGWGKAGYDREHPDVLPPGEAAGGWEGMRRLMHTCRELGYLFGIHDQYRDYYKDAATYDPEQAVVDQYGHLPGEAIWYGGAQSFLCAQFAPFYVRRNYTQFAENGIQVDGSYLDVFAVVEMDECFHPRHRMTREECMRLRAACFNMLRDRGIIISSEESLGWAVPYLDLVHHGPYALSGAFDDGPAVGIPVPLFNLVYHECMVLPWTLTTGGWGIPRGDSGLLHAYLNGGTGYLSIEAGAQEIERVQALCDFQARVAHAELLRHEFVGGLGSRRQRSTFSNGAVVEADFDSGTVLVTG